jgi:ABC-type transport system involved in multi-copper enzyme maturation permease subunit
MPVFLRWILAQGPLNPIAVRLVQNGSRRTRHLYIRSIYLGVLILVLLWLLITSASGNKSFSDLAKSGALSFTLVAYLQIGLICVLAPVFMAGAIAQEASPRTWEVLLTTPLSSTQIVIGNLLGRLFFILALLFASLPLFALTQFFGGVPGSAIFSSYLVSGSAAVLVGAIAIALAVSRMAGTRSVFAFYVSVVSYIAITAGIDSYMRSAGMGAGGGKGVTIMTALNPFLALQALLNPSTYPKAELGTVVGWGGVRALMLETPVKAWCIGSLLLSFLLVVGSTFSVRAGGLGALTSEAGIPWYRRILGLGAVGADHRPPRPVGSNPIAWRESTARNATLGRIIARWSFIAAGLAFGGLLVWFMHTKAFTATNFREALMATVWGEIAVISLVAINMSSTAVSREREDGTLDLLLTSAITPASYLTGKLRGLVAYLLPLLMVPIGTLAMAAAYTVSSGATVPVAGRPAEPLVLPEGFVLATLVCLPFIAWCVMVGLQWSLKSKGTLSSVVGTVGVVGVIAGTVGLCGYKSAESIVGVGPALAALSPVTLFYAIVNPDEAMRETTAAAGGLEAARVSLAVGALVAGGIYTAVVLGIHAGMVRTFDATVRRLAGQR